jgi:uncharacterized alkaline shock family protein YloU
MNERDRPRSPLESERGRTTVKDRVVSKIASVAAGEVEGIRMGGSTSRAAAGVFGSVTGSQSQTQGISADVGRTEAAIDVTMGIEYGGNILQLAETVRGRVSERVESLTGLRVTELTVTVSDVIFPEDERGGSRGKSGSRTGYGAQPQARQTEEIEAGSQERGAGNDAEPIDLGTARTEAVTRAGRGTEEDIPPGEDQTAELRLDDEETERIRRRDREE